MKMSGKTGFAYCHDIIDDVSRTFALSIERAGDLLSDYTCVGYLLCRIPDTVEDCSQIPTEEKLRLLKIYGKILQSHEKRQKLIDDFIKNLDKSGLEGPQADLIRNTSEVFRSFESFYGNIRQSMIDHVSNMVKGMRSIIRRYDKHGVRIKDMDEFSEYSYYVAGTVGELLTDLFQTTENLSSSVTADLEKNSKDFGEALQTVNIIKDIFKDYKEENNIYIPNSILKKHGTSQEKMLKTEEKTLKAIDQIRNHSKTKLGVAEKYIKKIPFKAKGARRFTIIPYLLARSTIRETEQKAEDLLNSNPVKINRSEVFSILDRLPKAVKSNQYLSELASEASKREITRNTSL